MMAMKGLFACDRYVARNECLQLRAGALTVCKLTQVAGG